MDSKIIISIVLVIILLSSIYGSYTTEHFGIIDELMEPILHPGQWVGQQVGGVVNGIWSPLRAPLTFARDVFYNVSPNYTMVDRYLVKKNDWVRANKGIPLMNPVGGSVSFKFDDKRDDTTKRYAATVGTDNTSSTVGTSIMNKIF